MKVKTVPLSAADIARAVGLTQSCLTQLKSSEREGRLGTLLKFIAAAERGDIDLDDINPYFKNVVTRIIDIYERKGEMI